MNKFYFIIYFNYFISNIKINKIEILNGDWGLGIGDWGLGIGDWAQSPIPKPKFELIFLKKIIIYIFQILFNNIP